MNTAALPSAERSSWLAWGGLIAGACIATGIYWDISWHESIGRDTFWTPAHLLIQFGAVLAGLGSAWMIFRTTLSPDTSLRRTAVNVLGFSAPLGAFVLAWGAVAMLTSAPFDNWWHEAYGLDVKIISPPHMLLALGITGINWGAAFLILAEMSRSEGVKRTLLHYMFLAMGGLIVLQSMTLKLEYINRVLLHSAISYMVISIGMLLLLEALARASGHRWARTIITGFYSLFVLLMLWILPLFPAQPKLGPVYQTITHMVPLPFPILIVVPAFVLDLIWPTLKDAPKWQQALLGGVMFMAILIVVEWPFATFLMSKAARNWAFAPNDFPYFAPPTSPTVRRVFIPWEHTRAEFAWYMGLAFVISVVSMRIGITYGEWMRKLRR
jgi:hypothetical protein